MLAVPCNSSTPASTIGLEYPGEIINGSKEHTSDKNVLLFVKMATGSDEDCDAGPLNGQYGICNSTCSGKPFCGDNNVSTGNEICDEGLGDGGNKTIEAAWSANYGGTCIGKFYDELGNNVCTDTPDKWNAYGVADKCCQFGRYCGDGIVDNSLDGVGSTNDEGIVTNPNEWRNEAKWNVEDGSLVDVYTEDLDLAIGMTLKKADEYQDVELDIEIPIVEGLRYFVEYDVKVQKVNDETVTMHAGAKMYDSDDNAIPTCTGEGCLDTNPLFFVENSETPLAGNVWINKKNSTPVVKADSASSSANNWKENTSYVKLYFQFKGKKYTSFIIRGLKVYTLESGKGAASGQGADEMCDNGAGNLDIEAAKADTSYMSACTKYVNETDRKQAGCRWTNYCGDKRKHSVEACDNGENKTNVYNGCEPGCTEVGPRCGDAMLDIKPGDECPFKKIDEEACEALGLGDVCEEYTEDETKCNRVSEKYSGNTYDAEGNFTGTVVNFVSESCDTGSTNSNQFLGTKNEATVTITETNLDINNYGTCRTDCTFSRCGDGILDYVVRADENGVPKTKEVLDSNGNPVTVYDYVEECDCGFVESALLPGYESSDEFALNQKTSEGVYICKDATGRYFPNSNNGEKTDGVSCRSNCTISRCGDGVRDYNEACDDGNNDDHDDCTNNCQLKSSCGDGIFSFKRSYLCEELLDLPLSSSDSSVPTMTTMRDRGVVDCCDAGDTACLNKGNPLCSKLVSDLQTAEGYSYGQLISGKLALHYWFERKVMHCCFNKKYETGNEADDDKNCINSDHVFGDINTLKDFVDFTCQYQSDSIIDPWEKCGNVSYSERCEFCDAKNAKCGCDKAFAVGSSAYEKCMENCEKDPCGCVAYCKYKDPDTVESCAGDDSCIKESLKGCISACEDRNKYCDTKNTPCWNRNGACGDGVVGYREPDPADPDGPGIVVGNVNEKCDNMESGSPHYVDFDGRNKDTTAQDLSVRGGRYCTGTCRGDCASDDTDMCHDTDSFTDSNCWEAGCSTADHGTGSLSRCGDGRKDTFAGEACDEGDEINGYYGHCNKACSAMLARCGDGTAQTGTDEYGQAYNEKCDDGDANNGKYKNDSHGYCNTDCQGWGDGGFCGDGTIQNSSSTNCTCTDENCKNADGLPCKPNVAGAAETCDDNEARTQSLTNTGLLLSTICSSCAQPDTCGDGNRNPRFEGCDCSEGDGSGTCTETYGSLKTYGNTEGVGYNCFTGCKAEPIGNLETVLPVELSGWACDPDHPMEHPEFVELVFYDRNSNVLKTTEKIKTQYDVSSDVVKACGGGSKHGWFYNPNTEGAGVTDFETQNPITVKVFAYSVDKIKDNSSVETQKIQIGEATLTLGQQCGDGLVTKCADIPIIPKTGSGTIQDGWVCHDEGNSCGSNTSCIEVRGTCSAYGLANNVACVDEKCDEGSANGPTGKCYDKTYGTACDYSYCGDSKTQKDGNGKAFSTSVGYNESGYTSPSNPKAFNEECEGTETTACSNIFKTACSGSTETGGCVPSGATVKQTASCAKDSSNKSTCKWKKTSECEIEHDCPSLEDEATRQGYGWSDSANFLSYANGETVAKYTRTWDGDSWEPAAPTALKHNNTTPSTTADQSCFFKCYNEGLTDGTAKLVWNESTKKCVKQNGTLQCNKCSDPNGVNASTGTACNTNNWKPVAQTINVSSAGIVSISPTSLPAPAEASHLPTGNNGDCSYVCKEGTEYAKVYGTASTYQCQYSKPKVKCTGLNAPNEVWAKVTKSGTSYTVEKVSELYVEQTLNPDTGVYLPAATRYKFANDANIKDGSVVDDNQCYFMCAKGYLWNGSSCALIQGLKCGDGVLTTNLCDQSSVYNNISLNPSYSVAINGKTYGCYYDPNPESQETCDDGTSNGKYTTGITLDNGTKTSACNTSCNGRIKNGSEFFCGDKKVQKKSGDTSACGSGNNQSSNCVTVTGNGASQYPGPDWIESASSFTSELCDPEDSSTKNNVNKLCNMALGLNRSDYYTPSTKPSCNSSCTGISNAVKGTNCMYCGDETINGSENCEVLSNGIRYGNGSNDVLTYSGSSLTYEYTTSKSWEIKVSGLYTIQIEGAKGGKGGKGREGEYSDQQDGSAGSSGSVVARQYYLKAGTTVSFTRGENGSAGNTAGSGRAGVSPGGSGGSRNGGTGSNGSSGGEHSICGDAGGGGSGGGGGGAAYLTIGSDLIITANGGAGGAGGKGGGGKGGLACLGGNQGDGGAGGAGGAGGTYDSSHSNWANTSSGTGWKYIGTATAGSATGSSKIKISLNKYAPCNSCQFSTSTETSDFLSQNQRKIDCTGLIANAQWNTVASITQTYSSGSWSPTDATGSHNTSASSSECRYRCVNNYVYEGSQCIHTKSASCSGLPSNAVWSSNSSTSKTITMTYSGTEGSSGSWSPSTTGTYNESTATDQCYYKCKSGYHNESGACVSSADKVYTCTGLPANAEWNSVGAYTQRWDGSAWTPAASSATYNTTASTTSCRYKCKSGYTWEGGACINTKTTSCGTLPAGGAANTVSSITQNWTSANGWQPAATWEYNETPSTAACHYKCKSGLYRIGDQCLRTSWSFENSDDMFSNPISVSYPNGYNWSTTDNGGVGAYSGSKAMCSGNYKVANTTSTMQLEINMPEDGNISFYVKGASESTSYDYLTITLDGSQMVKTASLTSWTRYSYDLSAGSHTLSFAYRKDGSQDTSYDSYCIDAVKLKLSSVLPPLSGTWGIEDEYTNYGFIAGITNSNSSYPWQQLSTDVGTHSGSYAMCSTNYNVHSTDTSMTMTVKVPIAGTLSFYLKGTSENSSTSDWDTFYFSIDGSEKFNSRSSTTLDGVNKTGWQSWTNPSYNLSAGTHTLTFRYKKDGSTHQPTDRYCFDDLTLTLPSCSGLSMKSAPLYLKFNEGTGSTTANSGTVGGSYSVSGGSWVSSFTGRGKAYKFNGSTTVSTTGFRYSDNFTMMAWVKVADGATITLPSQSSSGTNGTSGQHYLFGANHEGGNAGAGLSVGTNGIFVTAHGDGYMPPLAVYSGSLGTDWHHVAVVFNSRTPYIYLDGVLVQTGSASSRTTYSPTAVGNGSYGSFYGTLDDVRIIGSALSAQEVMEEYGKLALCNDL